MPLPARRSALRRVASVDRQVRRARAGAALHPPTGAPSALLAAALDVRLGYLLGAPDLVPADVGAAVLVALAPGPTTRAAGERTLAGFLAEHAGRAAALAPGRVLGARHEARLAADAVVLALLAQAAGSDALAASPAAAPARAGLDDTRLAALVDPRVVAEVVRLTGAAERTLWRPLATADVARVGEAWRLGGVRVAVDLAAGPWAAPAATRALVAAGEPTPVTWLGRYEQLLVHRSGADAAVDAPVDVHR